MTIYQNLTALLYFNKEASQFFKALPSAYQENITQRNRSFHSYQDLRAYVHYLQEYDL